MLAFHVSDRRSKVRSVMPASVPPSSSGANDSSSLALQLGCLVGLAAAAGLLGTLPAMLRVSAALVGVAPVVRAWAALVAAMLGPMALSIMVLRGARQGLRAFGTPVDRLLTFGLALWLSLLFVSLALFGSILRATTHHHALAGVTYACGALVLAVGWGLLCGRIVLILRGVTPRTRRWAVNLLGAGALLAIGYVGVRFVRVVSKDPSSSAAAGTVVDVLAFLLTACLASLDWRAARRPLAVVGPPVALFLGALGATTLRDPPVHHAIVEHAPAFLPVVDMFSSE
jgi:hypothetical protein